MTYVSGGYVSIGYVAASGGFDPVATVASQYQNSSTILALINSLNQNLYPDDTFEQFYEYVWNINTAQGFGLDILGRILNAPRQLNVPAIFPFTAPSGLLSLSDDQYRTVLKAKAFTNISGASVPSLNTALRTLFAGRGGNAYVVNLGGMHMRYKLLFAANGFDFGIMQQGMLPEPAGVQVDGIQTLQPYFGFSEGGSWSTFGENVFASY